MSLGRWRDPLKSSSAQYLVRIGAMTIANQIVFRNAVKAKIEKAKKPIYAQAVDSINFELNGYIGEPVGYEEITVLKVRRSKFADWFMCKTLFLWKHFLMATYTKTFITISWDNA